MIQSGILPSAHTDLVTDAAFDYYGLRLATCGVDQRIKVWLQDESTGQWSVEDDWKAHDAPICALSWAHPEYGTILASASTDRTTKVWERRLTASPAHGGSRWAEVAALGDAKGAVRCAAFAPAELGLKLATLATDNTLRLYECLETASGAQWELREELDMTSPHLAMSPGATPTQTLSAPRLALTAPSPPASSDSASEGAWSLSWCKEAYWGPMVAVAVASSAFLRLIHLPPALRPSCALSIGVSGATAVGWAPLMGRAHHLLATGSRDGHVRIYKLIAPSASSSFDDAGRWTAECLADFDEHAAFVSKVEWNLTGTILSSSGHDGRVRLWKASYSNIWRPMGYVTAEAAEEPLELPEEEPQD